MLHDEAVARESRLPPPVALHGRGPVAGGVRGAIAWAERRSLGLERRGLVLFAGLSSFYYLVTAVLAARKLMWNDELYTYYLTMLPSMRAVWRALMTGAEQTPPFFYLTTRVAVDLFGVNNISIRLPAMLGFWVMSACLFVFVARRTSWFPALCAAAFPLVTTAYHYAFEARAYGPVLGFAGLALFSWQAAAHGRWRVPSLVCLAASLSAGVSSHYYAIFVILPLALGEATRNLMSRRLDLAVWAAFFVPAVPLALHLPLIRAGQAYSSAFWSPPQWVNVPDFYADLLTPAIVTLAAIVVLAVINAALVQDDQSPPVVAPAPAPPAWEIVAACGFIIIPIVSVVLAKLATGAFVDRYALPTVLGFSVLAGFGTAVAFRNQPLMRLMVCACIVGWFAVSQAREFIQPTGFSMPVSSITVSRPVEWLNAAPRELPFVVADPHTFTVLSHYGPPEMKGRIVYLSDPDLAMKFLGYNSVERGMLDLLKPWFGMNVREFESFVAEHPRFLVYGDFFRMAFLNWLTPELQRRGMRLELLNRQGDNLFLLATRRGAPELSARAEPLHGR